MEGKVGAADQMVRQKRDLVTDASTRTLLHDFLGGYGRAAKSDMEDVQGSKIARNDVPNYANPNGAPRVRTLPVTDPPANRNGLLELHARAATHNKTRRRPVVATRRKLKYYSAQARRRLWRAQEWTRQDYYCFPFAPDKFPLHPSA
ncbi:hypothetical protein EVAR_46877_1 [Eumeta japonica]|uniref:Uncharacterized protein n=1 Tax=Eumeta variegata TaxID=151549 RepID=A0A4C1XPV3_EUMVA|nr:hypothetical protein EVAR_46877_1 [Eumeta japonica]